MSLEVIKTQIRSFLRSREPEVLAIRGDWGVGKTFTWDQVLNECQQEKMHSDPNAIGLSYYSYVSLFGVTTLQDLRTEIAFNKLNTLDLKHSEGVTKFQKSSGKYIPKLISQALKYTGINAGTLIDTMFASMSNSMIRNTIICIDDFERSTIGEKEALGFINDLKCKRDCKIVLLLNDRKTEEFQSYREKVIDYDVRFDLTPQEATTLIFGETTRDDFYQLIIDHCNKIGTNNLRVIKKIRDLVDSAVDHHGLQNYNIDLHNQFVRSAVLASYCFYEHDPNAPTIEYIKNDELRLSVSVSSVLSERYSSGDDESEYTESNELYKSYENFLHNYRFIECDKFDREVFKAVESGFIDKQEFLNWAAQRNEYFNNSDAHNEVADLRHSLTNKFMTDKETTENIKELSEACKRFSPLMSKSDLNELYILFDSLDFQDEKNTLFEDYKRSNRSFPAMFSTDTSDDLRHVNWHNELNKKMDNEYRRLVTPQSSKQILDSHIGDVGMFNEDEINTLNSLTENEIENIILETEYQRFAQTLELLVKAGNIDSRLETMRGKVFNVLKGYAEKSKQANYLLTVKFGPAFFEEEPR